MRITPNQPNHTKGNGATERLVEDFVVVTTRQCKPSGKYAEDTSQPTLRQSHSQVKARLAARRAHMPGEKASCNVIRLSSIADSSTVSSSTYESDEISNTYTSEINMTPSDLPFNQLELDTPKSSEFDTCLLEPVISARYPANDRHGRPLNPKLPRFCHPKGANTLSASPDYKMPHIHHFVLTESNGGKQYGTCLTFYEEIVPDENSFAAVDKKIYYAPKVLCLLSTYPYLSSFRTYLTQLYRLATTTDLMEAPIERYVLNICEEVPAPTPGSFEVQLNIMNTKIRFWAPPANQPIAYVGLPFEALFECLDIGNVLYTWYSLVCEHKVLLVSDQLSLLAVNAEIFCSLLFPIKWNHLYVPLLPLSLSPMLDAPMPYFCGISRDNFQHAASNISDETVVVDLDKNLISLGSHTPELPPIPHKAKMRLEVSLKNHAGHVFWNARGVSQDQIIQYKHNNDAWKEINNNANFLWKEHIKTIDDAFTLAPIPDSTIMSYDNDMTSTTQSRWDAVQEAFITFFANALRNYRKFITGGSRVNISWRALDRSKQFKCEEFISSERRDFKPLLEELVSTQAFEDFITRRMNSPSEPDVIFFDKTIEAQKNNTILKKNRDATFLHSANAHKKLHQYTAILPNQKDIPRSEFATAGSLGHRVFIYPSWPETFDASMFGIPRPFPKDIAAVINRTITLSGGRSFVVPRDPFREYHQEN